ncbi:MAG: CPBP family intramembrane glutamic endopeptidase [Gemmatimonadota bacterium]
MSFARTTLSRPKPELLIVLATVVLVVFYYVLRADVIATLSGSRGSLAMTRTPVPPTLHFVGAALILAVVPVLIARFGLRLRFSDLGLGLGRWRVGLVWLAIGIPLAVIVGKIGSANPEMRFVYPLDPTVRPELSAFIPYALLQFLYFGAWEVLFRGVLLFGLKGRIGAGPANAVQTALSVIAHFGRPFSETFIGVPAGLVLGGVCLNVRSMWYVAIIHWVVGISLDWFILTG